MDAGVVFSWNLEVWKEEKPAWSVKVGLHSGGGEKQEELQCTWMWVC